MTSAVPWRAGALLSAVVLATSAIAEVAVAQSPAYANVRPDSSVVVAADPVLGLSLVQRGMGEIAVRIENHHDHSIDGRIEIHAAGWAVPIVQAAADYHVDANGSALVHLPVSSSMTVFVQVKSASGTPIYQKDIGVSAAASVCIADIEEISRIGPAIGHVAINADYRPNGYYGGYGGTSPVLDVVTAKIAPETGDPILPRYVVGWQGVDVALVPSDTLSRLEGVELEALSAFVMSGGTLAVVVRRPEDLRSDVVKAFAGGEVGATRASSVELETVVLAPPQPPNIAKWRSSASAPLATTEVQGFVGGNLAPSVFGASAAYGLGQFVVLGFDPTKPETAEDPWVQIRIAELGRQAFERRAISAVDPGDSPSQPGYGGYQAGAYEPIRKLLDPNENARWGIAVAAGMLCIYAIVAGPIAFARAKKKKRPLLALAVLPLLSLVAFVAIVGLGFVSKGTSARARHLTMIDAGAGMSRGVAHRFRGFFSTKAGMLDIVPTGRTSALLVNARGVDEVRAEDGWISVDRDGAYLADVAAAPWQTLVVREDGIASIGGGVSISDRAGTSELTIKNATTKPLESVIIKLANDEFRFVARIEPGKAIDTAAERNEPAGFRGWTKRVVSTRLAGRTAIHALNADSLPSALGQAHLATATAWQAIDASTSDATDWFPSGVPVVLAEVEGGEGRETDTGMRVDSDRVLLRVVGLGGEP